MQRARATHHRAPSCNAPFTPQHAPRSARAAQVDEPAHTHGLDQGWAWLARLLNSLPADRLSAKALVCFLRPAGYALHARCGRAWGLG